MMMERLQSGDQSFYLFIILSLLYLFGFCAFVLSKIANWQINFFVLNLISGILIIIFSNNYSSTLDELGNVVWNHECERQYERKNILGGKKCNIWEICNQLLIAMVIHFILFFIFLFFYPLNFIVTLFLFFLIWSFYTELIWNWTYNLF